MRSTQLGLLLKQVGSLIRCSRLKVSVECCKFLSSGVTLNFLTMICFHNYLDILKDFSTNFLKIRNCFGRGACINLQRGIFFNVCLFRDTWLQNQLTVLEVSKLQITQYPRCFPFIVKFRRKLSLSALVKWSFPSVIF